MHFFYINEIGKTLCFALRVIGFDFEVVVDSRVFLIKI